MLYCTLPSSLSQKISARLPAPLLTDIWGLCLHLESTVWRDCKVCWSEKMFLLRLTGGLRAVLFSQVFFLKLQMTSSFFKGGFNSLKMPAKNLTVKYYLEICGKPDTKRDLGIPMWKAYDKETCSLLTWHAFFLPSASNTSIFVKRQQSRKAFRISTQNQACWLV